MKRLISTTIAVLLIFSGNIGFSETKKPVTKATVTTSLTSQADIAVLYNGNKISFKEKPYLIGKEIMVPAEPFFKMLSIEPKIDNSTGIYSFNFDGADVSFNPASGSLTFAQHYMPFTTHNLTKTCLVKNKVLYLNSSRFPFCWLGVGTDAQISSDGKSAKLYMSTNLKSIEEKFIVTDSRNGKFEKNYKKDKSKPLDVSWTISLSYETLSITDRRLNIAEKQMLPEGESRSEYHLFKYSSAISDIRSLSSNEMGVYDILLYNNGQLVKTLHDFAPPRMGSSSSILTTASEFDEIRFRASTALVNQLDEAFKADGVTIETVDEAKLLEELKQSSYYKSLSFYDADRATPEVVTNSLLNQGSTVYANSSRLISGLSNIKINESTVIVRTQDKYDNFNISGTNTIKLTLKPHAFALYDQSLNLIKVVYLSKSTN